MRCLRPFALLVVLMVCVRCSGGDDVEVPTVTEPSGIDKIDHLIFIVMENRSFDHYFGTYPGANGIPKKVCVPDPSLGGRCQEPYHDTSVLDAGGPHTHPASLTDVNDGKMDGFLTSSRGQPYSDCPPEADVPRCRDRVGPDGQAEVMGYHDRREIPLYWQLADWGVLQDAMFAPTDSWTLPAHLFLMSAWSAVCTDHTDPMSCRSAIGGEGSPRLEVPQDEDDTPYAWTDITYLLNKQGVSWGYYVSPEGTCYVRDCDGRENEDMTTGYQNPMPGFLTVTEAKAEENIMPYTEYVASAQAGGLPAVSWVIPAINESDHPGAGTIIAGQRFVAAMVNAAAQGPDWNSTAIFIVWDDWGGFYDHVEPPRVDVNGYGLRVPGLLVSPYAKAGYIDSQTLTFDAYLKLIEDRFLGGERIDPATNGRPDPRPTVREEVPQLGDLVTEFDFDQSPRQLPVLEAPEA